MKMGHNVLKMIQSRTPCPHTTFYNRGKGSLFATGVNTGNKDRCLKAGYQLQDNDGTECQKQRELEHPGAV